MESKFFYILMTMVCSLLAGCREELCYNHFGAADISFEWYADDHPGAPSPEGITVLVYDESGRPTEVFLSPSGGSVNFGEGGAHSMLLYNNDTESVIISGESHGPLEVCATSTPGRRGVPAEFKELHPDEPVLSPPDMLYAAYITSIPDVGNHETAGIPIDMKPLVFVYEVRYEFEYGFNRVTDARGAISGMSRWVYLYNGATPTEAVTLVYDCKLDKGGITATVLSFGTPGRAPEPSGQGGTGRTSHRHTLNLEVELTNGKTKEFNFDVTDQLVPQPKGGTIVVSNLRIEDNESGSNSGFDPDINDWDNDVEIDLPVGGQQK
ncbi:DUF5119 domain-containing protein [Bacteroides caecimuris]|uniref:DUF5119 domain-containing protein n=1 Tax=Bacteroides caecimuris TaxID=1796613 RepID=UPI00265D108C|nr:DUF5119 domain-containing protein [Bacteroides caecimuris]